MPGDSRIPPHVQRCVRAVGQKTGDVQKAFAICVSSGQKHGTLKKGTIRSTAKGQKADVAKSKDKDHDSKTSDYEAMLARSRKRSEHMSRREEMLKLLGETEVTTPVNKPATAQKKPEKETAKIPNVQTSGKKTATGQVVTSPTNGSNKPATAQKKPEKETAKIPNVQTSEKAEDEDPILKLAVEACRSPIRNHPFE